MIYIVMAAGICLAISLVVLARRRSDYSHIGRLKGVSTISGAPMPLGAPKLSRAELNAIASWIDAGALNN